ncbi:MAG: TonB-dependent receptor plug domain-containing protein, partial [bacterium]|nr:TonB-dependent receptor plug domain-containing protein [bacterium]
MRLLLVGLILMVPSVLFAQDVGGRIVYIETDGATRPLANAVVSWKGSTKGVYTDTAGKFVLARAAGYDTLIVRAVGYAPLVVAAITRDMVLTMEPMTSASVVVEADQPTILRSTEKTEFISQDQLRQAACCSLAESFEKSPSVEVSYSDAASGARQIQMLGLRGLYTQVLIEAVPMLRALEMPYGLEHIPGPFMESVSISKGAGTVTNGYDAITGLINVCYHNPRTAPTLFVNAYGNTQSRAELNVYGAQHVTDELSTMTMLHGRIMPQASDQNTDGFADQPTFKQLNAVHRWYFNNDAIEWQLFVRGFVDSYEGGQIDKEDRDSTSRLYSIKTDLKRLDGFIKFGLLDLWESIPGSGISFVVAGATHEQ